MLERRRHRGIEVIIYQEAAGLPRRFIPVSWTNLAEPDPWLDRSGDRSPFRLPDLLQLVALIREVSCQEDFAESVKRIPPKKSESRRGRNR